MRFFIDADRDIVAMDGNSDVAVVWSGELGWTGSPGLADWVLAGERTIELDAASGSKLIADLGIPMPSFAANDGSS